jgi:hypothetical protein
MQVSDSRLKKILNEHEEKLDCILSQPSMMSVNMVILS